MIARLLFLLPTALSLVGCLEAPGFITFREGCSVYGNAEIASMVVHNSTNSDGEIVLSGQIGEPVAIDVSVDIRTALNEPGANFVCFEVWERDLFLNPDDYIADGAVPMAPGATSSRFDAFSLTCDGDGKVRGISSALIEEFSLSASAGQRKAEVYFTKGNFRSKDFAVVCPNLTVGGQ